MALQSRCSARQGQAPPGDPGRQQALTQIGRHTYPSWTQLGENNPSRTALAAPVIEVGRDRGPDVIGSGGGRAHETECGTQGEYVADGSELLPPRWNVRDRKRLRRSRPRPRNRRSRRRRCVPGADDPSFQHEPDHAGDRRPNRRGTSLTPAGSRGPRCRGAVCDAGARSPLARAPGPAHRLDRGEPQGTEAQTAALLTGTGDNQGAGSTRLTRARRVSACAVSSRSWPSWVLRRLSSGAGSEPAAALKALWAASSATCHCELIVSSSSGCGGGGATSRVSSDSSVSVQMGSSGGWGGRRLPLMVARTVCATVILLPASIYRP